MGKNKETIEVACNLDDNYVKYCVVMLTSLFVNNPSEEVRVHVIAENLSETSRRELSECVETKYRQRLMLHIVGNDLLSQCPVNPGSYISIAACLRCFLASVLPPDIHKVFYLDCDLLVCGSIAELWNSDLNGLVVGAVEDMWSGKQEYYSRLCYPEKHSYFNSGVLLVNLDYWRQNNTERDIAAYFAKYPQRLKFDDQDALNAVLHAQKKLLPMRWNMQDGFFRRKRKMRSEAIATLDEEMPKTVILHFTGPKKPWFDTCRHPYRKMYFKYLDLTKWKGERPPIHYLSRLNDLFLSIQGLMGLKNTYRRPHLGIN